MQGSAALVAKADFEHPSHPVAVFQLKIDQKGVGHKSGFHLTKSLLAFIIDFAQKKMLGCSQVGKAQDFDSCIPLVRVQPSQPFISFRTPDNFFMNL